MSLFVFVVIAVLFSVSRLSIQHLIICSADSEAFTIPQSVCKYYLYNFTGEDDAHQLDDSAGLAFAYQIQNTEEKYNIINHLISVGVNINGISNIDGLTPLNAAILINDSELVKHLLDKGASPEKKDRANQLNARQYIEALQKSDLETNRKKIHQIISSE